MNIIRIKKLESGFILYITLIMLIIFAIVGVSLYQQTSMSTVALQYITFKQEAEDLAFDAVNKLEKNIFDGSMPTTWNVCPAKEAPGADEKENRRKLANRAMLCDPIPSDMLSEAIGALKAGKDLLTTEFKPLDGDTKWKWSKLTGVSFKTSGDAYYIVQYLGKDGGGLGYSLYRVTVLSDVLNTHSAMDAVVAKPPTP